MDVSGINLYLYDGTVWVPAMDENGNVLPGGIDFIKPSTRVNHNNGTPSAIEVQVYHFTGIQAVNTGATAVASSARPLPPRSQAVVVVAVVAASLTH